MKRTLIITAIVIACLGGLYIFLTWNNNGNPRFMHHRYNKVVTEPLAKLGIADAQYRMGLFCLYGNGESEPTTNEIENAVYWWEKASAKGNEKATIELAKAQELLEKTNHPIESKQILSDSTTNQETLNDIRFGCWTEKDWYDNDYFRFMRQAFNDCLVGKREIEGLTPYKSLLSSKFAIMDANPFIMGGLFVYFTFIDAPDKVFSVCIYSDVNEDSGTVTGYEIFNVSLQDEDSGFTKDEILKLVKEHPEHKLW